MLGFLSAFRMFQGIDEEISESLITKIFWEITCQRLFFSPGFKYPSYWIFPQSLAPLHARELFSSSLNQLEIISYHILFRFSLPLSFCAWMKRVLSWFDSLQMLIVKIGNCVCLIKLRCLFDIWAIRWSIKSFLQPPFASDPRWRSIKFSTAVTFEYVVHLYIHSSNLCAL